MGLFSSILAPAAGAAAGGFLGGPAGALAGASLGQGLFGSQGKNPAKGAQGYIDQIPGVGYQNYSPYISQGRDAAQMTDAEYTRLLQDPTGFIDQILSSYKPSQGYQFRKDELGRELSNTAAAGGFAGTQYDQSQRGKLLEGLLSQDMQQYLQNVLGVHGTGLLGKEGIADRGFNASSNLADYVGSALGQQGGLGFAAQQYQNMGRQNRNNAFATLGGHLAGGAFGGGGAGGNGGFNGGFNPSGNPSTVPGAAFGGGGYGGQQARRY